MYFVDLRGGGPMELQGEPHLTTTPDLGHRCVAGEVL